MSNMWVVENLGEQEYFSGSQGLENLVATKAALNGGFWVLVLQTGKWNSEILEGEL